MVNINNKICGSLIDFMVSESFKDLDGSNAQISIEDYRKHRDMLLNAYNSMCNEESQGGGYIFDSNNGKDIVYLLENGYSFKEIANTIGGEYKYCQMVWNGELKQNVLEPMDEITMVNILKSHMRDLMECVVLYTPFVEEYMEVYKEYVTNRCNKES